MPPQFHWYLIEPAVAELRGPVGFDKVFAGVDAARLTRLASKGASLFYGRGLRRFRKVCQSEMKALIFSTPLIMMIFDK